MWNFVLSRVSNKRFLNPFACGAQSVRSRPSTLLSMRGLSSDTSVCSLLEPSEAPSFSTSIPARPVDRAARVALRTANVDYNGRFCMSTAAAAATAALGVDRGLPFPLEDIAHTGVILLVGANVAETMPPILQYFAAQQANGGALIVVDPRRTPTALWAKQHLQLKPGSDAALANGLLHVLIRDGLVDEAYVRDRTEGFEEARRVAATYWPERVEQLTGIAEGDVVEAAHRIGKAQSVMILTARGPEQQAQGVNNTLAYINIALALGKVGAPFSGYGTLTGQGNG